MKFFSQLSLLTWKNFTLRRRQKLRLVIELTWPIVIFLILALVRRAEMPTPKHECHFLSKALPSAGLLPFFQSFMCDFQSECHQNETYGELKGKVNNFRDSGLTKLVDDVEKILTNQTTVDTIMKLLAELSELNKLLPFLDGFDNITDAVPGSKALLNYLKDPEEMKNFLTNDINLSPAVADAILNSSIDQQELLALLDTKTLQDAACDKTQLQKIFGITNETTLDEMQKELCNLTAANFTSIVQVLASQIDLNKLIGPLLSPGSSGGPAGSGLSADSLTPIVGGLQQTAGLAPVYNLLTNASDLVDYLQVQLGLSQSQAQLLADSINNPSALMLLLQGHNMRDKVCDPTQLKNYVTTTDPAQLEELSEMLCNMSDTNLDQISQEIRTLTDFNALWKIVNGTEYNNLYTDILKEMMALATQISQLDSFNTLLEDISETLNGNDTSQLICGSVGRIMNFSDIDFGDAALGWDFNTISKSDGSKGVFGNGLMNNTDPDVGKPGDDCQWVHQIEATETGRIIWERMKPMVQGYILFTPDTKATKRIMKEAERPLTSIQLYEDLAKRWLKYSPTLRSFVQESTAFDLINEFMDNPELVDQMNDQLNTNATVDPAFLINLLKDAQSNKSENYTQMWLSAIDSMDMIANASVKILKCVNLDKMIGFDTEAELSDAARELQGNHTFWGGAVFKGFNDSLHNDSIPPHVKYNLRMDSSMVANTAKFRNSLWYPGPMSSVLLRGQYITGGFVFLQDMIDQGIIKASIGTTDANAGTYIQEFPYPCYIDDIFIQNLGAVLPLLMILSWVFSVSMIIKGIVLEKELRLKEVMKVMGMGNGVHWVAWFIDSFFIMFISSCLLVVVLKSGHITILTDASILLLMFVSFSISTIALCFLISTFFSTANLSAACGSVIFFLTYVPYTMAYSWNEVIPYNGKVALCLSNTIGFGYANMYLTLFEIQGTGVTWANINTKPITGGDGMTFLEVILMLWLDTILYLVLTWYIEAVHPGAYGMPRPWYFPCQRSYWFGTDGVDATEADMIPMTSSGVDPMPEEPDFEREPTHLKLGASICNLFKVYKTGKKLAVNDLSINFYEGQITSFLGHNGAGKTTTMSILTGLFPPTAGTAYIYGKNILTDISSIRKSLGMCPQHNVLFDHMTVAEHLWFYARVKGATNAEVAVEMEEMLKHLNLPHKRNEKTTSLSGGMKRKLSIAMAFVAGSKTVILDEPTAGVDPYARREIWDLLSKYKEGRTIIMSTHHMDEADILGDRIAIISSGQLRCSGSSLFLKSRFGSGYYLVLNKHMPGDDIVVPPELLDSSLYNAGFGPPPGFSPMDLGGRPDLVAGATVNPMDAEKKSADFDLVGASQNKVALEPEDGVDIPFKKEKPPVDIPDCGSCMESVVTRFIQSYIPGASLCENLGKELSYILPQAATQGGTLEFLFRELEMFKDQLYINSFGISDTTLEEVFLAVTDDVGVFNEGETVQATDNGLLPRPFMGRGSLRRRSYELPARSNSIIERRRRLEQTAEQNSLIDRDALDLEHQTIPEDSINFDDIDLGDGIAGADGGRPTKDEKVQTPKRQLDRKTSSDKIIHEPLKRESSSDPVQHKPISRQGSRERVIEKVQMRRQHSRQLSRQLSRQASQDALENQQTNDTEPVEPSLFTRAQSLLHPSFNAVPTEVEVSSVRMPDAESSEARAKDLSGRQVRGLTLIRRQCYALFLKRFHHFRRSVKGFFAQVILPVVFVSFAMLFGVLMPPQPDTKPLAMVPWLTGDSNYIFYSNDNPGEKLSQGMEDSVTNDHPGISTRCMADNPFVKDGFSCAPDESTDWHTKSMDPELYLKYLNESLHCYCTGKGFERCDEGAEGPPPPERHTPSMDILQNYSDTDVSWYLKTTTKDFIWKRFGGVSFLERDDMAPLTLNISKEVLDGLEATDTSQPTSAMSAGLQSNELVPENITIREIYAVMLSLARFQNVKVWWDNEGFHALPAFINMANNMLFRGHIDESKRSEYGISTFNYPINLTTEQLDELVMKQLPVNLATALFVVFALAFVPASFVVFLIMERVSKSKHLQIVSGVNRTMYWMTALCWDLTNYLIPAFLTILVFWCFNQQAYISPETAPATILLLLLYGWSVTPMSYPASFLFSTPSTAYLSLACGNMLLGILTITATFILDYLAAEDESLKATNVFLNKLFLIFPPYCLGRGLIDMSTNHLTFTVLSHVGKESTLPNPLDWDVMGSNLFAMAVTGALFFALTILIEYKFFLKPRHIKTESAHTVPEDDDVIREKHRVLSGQADGDVIRVESLTKDYNTSRGICCAVDRMCVGIPKGECFGLLGVNGAGKTTTFKMLTGDTQVTSGSAYVNGFSILKNMKRVSQSIGYCPQFDALNDLLTAEEHLAFYARLRGVPEEDIKKVVEWGISKLGLKMYAKRVAGTYSGGNKRKLSTAIALIGDPPVIFLDEPTTGMDPKARRFLWNRITSIVKEGRSVILTSHSMEECEALCTRVAIMVNGRFKCIGSTQHLKSKFGRGYTITIRVGGDPPMIEPLMRFVAEMFPHTVLRERHFNMLEYQMPTASASLAKVFGAFDANKQRFKIEDYSVSQTTLDQVFINFAKEQKTGDDVDEANRLLGLVTVNNPNVPNANQIILSPEYGEVRYIPDNHPVGANVYGGGVIHPDSSQAAFHNPLYNPIPTSPTSQPATLQWPGHPQDHTKSGDAKGYSNPVYDAAGVNAQAVGVNAQAAGVNAQIAENSNSNNSNYTAPKQPKMLQEGDSNIEDVLNDCLTPRKESDLENVLQAKPEGTSSTFC
ncbi:phospholipid-transporting ATPase ABCA1-like isoform X2 [Asterias amurensis]|uniref:phospholipid-transporting ATPase ABCA1-like isoform X2 n=1 Tax=Asterias amurensis TaxID=7602 RepID=UPI003AB8A83D